MNTAEFKAKIVQAQQAGSQFVTLMDEIITALQQEEEPLVDHTPGSGIGFLDVLESEDPAIQSFELTLNEVSSTMENWDFTLNG